MTTHATFKGALEEALGTKEVTVEVVVTTMIVVDADHLTEVMRDHQTKAVAKAVTRDSTTQEMVTANLVVGGGMVRFSTVLQVSMVDVAPVIQGEGW
jgi:hypothetical protein